MLPESLPPAFWDLKPVWKLLQEDGLPWALSWFDTDTIATIIETPTNIGWDAWRWIKLPYIGHHPRWINNESVLHLPDGNGTVTIISIGLSVLNAVAKNIPHLATEKYDLFQRIYALFLIGWDDWVWEFHFPETSDGREWYIISPNQKGINPYDILD